MKANKAIAVLAVPFAGTCLLLLAGMCATPYWECKVEPGSALLDLWKPGLFLLLTFSVVASIVLYIDLLIIKSISTTMRHRHFAIAIVGAATATVPRVLIAAGEGHGIAALAPQVEFAPFALAGAVFALALNWLLARPDKGG